MTPTIMNTDDVALCRALRRVVFMDEQGVSEADEIDDLDDDSIHLLAELDENPIGTARITVIDDQAIISRVCVLRANRGEGVGARLITSAIDIARDRGARTVKLGAQMHALAFYEAFGFEAIGPTYDDAGIPHRDMVRAL